jgi:hypothetical protein
MKGFTIQHGAAVLPYDDGYSSYNITMLGYLMTNRSISQTGIFHDSVCEPLFNELGGR